MATTRELAAATDQLRADFEAVLETVGSHTERYCKNDPTMFRMFCLGVMMCTQSFRGFVQEPVENALLPHMTPEDSCSAYYDAARRVFHAD